MRVECSIAQRSNGICTRFLRNRAFLHYRPDQSTCIALLQIGTTSTRAVMLMRIDTRMSFDADDCACKSSDVELFSGPFQAKRVGNSSSRLYSYLDSKLSGNELISWCTQRQKGRGGGLTGNPLLTTTPVFRSMEIKFQNISLYLK